MVNVYLRIITLLTPRPVRSRTDVKARMEGRWIHPLVHPALGLVLLMLIGCGPDRFTVIGAAPPGDNSVTGNWQINVKTTSGRQPFSALGGSVIQGPAQSNGQTQLFAILQSVAPDSCFEGLTTVPLQGYLSGSSFSLVSLSDSGQYINLSGSSGATMDTFTGKFLINDGCANGVKGTVAGSKIAPLDGTYAGPTNVAAGAHVSLTLSQDSFSDGYGFFHLQGSALFSGIGCFTAGTVQSVQSTIDGQQVLLTIATNEANSSIVTMTGTLNQGASLLTFTSVQVVSGLCSGASGTATLNS